MKRDQRRLQGAGTWKMNRNPASIMFVRNIPSRKNGMKYIRKIQIASILISSKVSRGF